MKVLNLLAKGEAGGIESLCVDTARYSADENYFYFFWGGGMKTDAIRRYTDRVVVREFAYKNILSEYLALKRYCKENAIDVVVCQGVSPVMMLFTLLLSYSGLVKTVLYLHADAKLLFNKAEVGKRTSRVLYHCSHRKLDGIIAISNSVKNSVRTMFGTADALTVIYNGVDTARFSAVERSVHTGTPTYIFVGRLAAEKNVELLLKALSLTEKPLRAIIVGDGVERPFLEGLARDLDLQERVTFAGAQTDIPKWLSGADVFIHPAQCDEGFGITLVEAMAAGVPCIAFDRGAIGEIITDGVDGFLIAEGTAEALAAKMDETATLFSQRNVWDALSSCAAQRALFFDIHKYVSNLNRFYTQL